MRRLKHPSNVLHFPTLSIADAGIYIDAKLGKGVLSFKKDGVNIPGYTDIDGDGSAFATGCKGAVAYTDDGIFKSRLLTFNAPAKAEDIYYNYGLTIQTEVKLPGVGTKHVGRFEKTYGGTLDVVETSGGYVTDAYKLAMENNIIDFITNDLAIHNQETDPRVKFAGTIVDAFRVYKVVTSQVDVSGTNVVVTYSPADGGADVTVTLDQNNMLDNLTAANSDLSAEPVIVLSGGASTYYFIATTAGDKFTMSTAVSTYSGTTTRHLMLVAKDEEVNFDVEFIGNEWTAESFGVQKLTWVGQHATTFVINGTAVSFSSGANSAAFVAAIIASTPGAAETIYAGKVADADTYLYVVFNPAAKTAWIKPADIIFTTVNTTNLYRCSPTGKYPSLSYSEVQKTVFNKKDGGRLSAMMFLDQAQKVAYAKYVLTYTGFEIYGEPLASENSSYVNEVIIYIPKSVAQTNYWDESDGMYGALSTTPDKDFEDMLWMWCDKAVSTW